MLRGDPDAHIVRGLIAILLKLYSGRTPADILAFDAKAGMARLGLAGALSAQRSNGLYSMVERIRRDAAAVGLVLIGGPDAGGRGSALQADQGVVAQHHVDGPAVAGQRQPEP